MVMVLRITGIPTDSVNPANGAFFLFALGIGGSIFYDIHVLPIQLIPTYCTK